MACEHCGQEPCTCWTGQGGGSEPAAAPDPWAQQQTAGWPPSDPGSQQAGHPQPGQDPQQAGYPPPSETPTWPPPPPPGAYQPPSGIPTWPPPGAGYPPPGAGYPPPGAGYPPPGVGGYPPPAYPPQPWVPGGNRSRGPWRKIAIGAGVVAGLLVILGVIGAIANNSKSQPDNSKAVTAPNRSGTPAGYTTFSDSTDGFSIAVPSSWARVDPSSPGAQAALNQVEGDNPALKTGLGGDINSLIAKGMKLLAIDTSSTADVAPNVNVIAQPSPGANASELPQVAGELPSEYSKIGATLLGTDNVTLDGHAALEATSELPLNTAAGNSVTAPEKQYFVPVNDFVYVITLTGDDPVLDRIAATFHVTP